MDVRILLILFWIVKEAKNVLFWIYLWQLKEYHFKRFIDHFKTYAGKSIFLNWIFGIKLLFVILFFVLQTKGWFLIYPLICLYFLEAGKGIVDFLRKRIKKPVATAKSVVLIFSSLIFFYISLILLFLFIKDFNYFIPYIVLLDLLSFFFVSIAVLFLQPITGFYQRKMLKKAEYLLRKRKDLLVIGITGSYGKTTTKEVLSEILSKKFNVLKTKKHINAEIGIAKTILEDLNNQDIFVSEIGAYERGKIKQVAGIIKPKIGVLTGINQQHMATFGSQENIIKGKFELIHSLPEDGLAVLNIDNEFIEKELERIKDELKVKNIILYGMRNKEKADIWAEVIKVDKDRIFFKVFTKEGEMHDCDVNLLGSHNILNILAALSVARYLGMDISEIAEACHQLNSVSSKRVLKKGINGINVIDCSYSANPTGVLSLLDYLTLFEGKHIVVMPCLIETGKYSKEAHRKIGKKIAKVCNLAIIITKDRFKEIKEGALEGGLAEDKILSLGNSEDIIMKIKEFCREGDAVLLEGRVSEKLKKGLILGK